jgi:CubicO group peptidase (beta-lactamase class C family)
MPLYDHDEPTFPPGTSWAYSNAGLALAGAIVEKVSGENYPDYIRRHVFAAAGMSDSDPNNIPHTSGKEVTRYTKMSEQGPTLDAHEAVGNDLGNPSGGAISTADDLIRFTDALRTGKLVSTAMFAELTRPHATTPWGGHYAYGFGIEETYGRTIVGHNGGFPGVSTHLYVLLDSPYTVVVLANLDPEAERYVGAKVVALVAEKAKRESQNHGRVLTRSK